MIKLKIIMQTIITVLLIFVILLAGCSSKTDNNRNQPMQMGPDDFPEDRAQFNRSMNLTDEEMKQQFEEMQQKAIDACTGKNEGDACQFQGPMDESNGTCKISDGELACAIVRPMRQQR